MLGQKLIYNGRRRVVRLPISAKLVFYASSELEKWIGSDYTTSVFVQFVHAVRWCRFKFNRNYEATLLLYEFLSIDQALRIDSWIIAPLFSSPITLSDIRILVSAIQFSLTSSDTARSFVHPIRQNRLTIIQYSK